MIYNNNMWVNQHYKNFNDKENCTEPIYLKTKRVHNSNKTEFLNDEKTSLSVSMSLFTILNICIEIGEEIISIKDLEIVQTYNEIFKVLRDNNLISKDIANKLSSFMEDRNMIAHQYSYFDIEKIYDLAEQLNIFGKIYDEANNYLKNLSKK